MDSKERLKEYIEFDEIYQKYKLGVLPNSDFDEFCIGHCKDIENLITELERLEEENRILKQSDKNTYESSQDMLAEQQERIDKAIEYANNCLNNIANGIENNNYTIRELISCVPTLQCIHNSYLKVLKGDSDE